LASCPKCLASIEIPSQFFGGLFTCPKCQGVYFLGFDGTPEQSAPHEPSNDDSQAQSNDFQTSEQPQNQFVVQVPDSEPQEIPNYDQPISQSPVTNLDDVMRYANTDTTPSPLSFKVCIQGLDLVQNLNELKEVLSDAKLQIKFEDLRRNIQNGQLIIDKLQPAKAAILAQRLRALDLKMIWEQKIYD